jgi:dephospho-CoA kinase
MFLVGLTGGIASGKSTVSQMMSEMGVRVIDADLIARQVVRPGMKAWVQIRDNFGPEVIQQNGEIDRQKLAQIIFNNEEKRLLLNRITHPEIYKEIYKQLFINLLFGKQFVVLDSPLLYESNAMTQWFHKVIVVNCSRDQQIERLITRNGFSFEESISRIDSQMSLEKKCRMSDFVINNSNDLNQTKEEVKKIVNELKSSYFQWKIRIPFYLISLTAIYLIAYSIKKVLNFSNLI